MEESNALSQARISDFESQTFGAFGDFMKFFDNLAFYHMRKKNIELQTSNTIQSYQNKMNALDNQLLAVKNKLQDKFNTAVANDIVQTAARGIRVSMSNILEKHKESAYNVTQDIQMATSNVEMNKATYKSYQGQAKIGEKLSKYKLTGDLVESGIKLAEDVVLLGMGGTEGLESVLKGGDAGSFGDLWSGYEGATKSQGYKSSYAKLAADFILS